MLDPIEFLCDLVALARDGEGAVQAAVSAALADLGCEVETIRYDPQAVRLRGEFASGGSASPGERAAVLGRLKGAGAGRSCILFAHPDSEPFRADHGWTANPFAARRVGSRLHGWGVADDLAGVAAMVCGLQAALADGWRPRGDIVVASTPSKRHARGAAAVLDRMVAAGGKPDAAIYLHPAESGAGMGEIKACTPGLLEFRIDFGGAPPATVEPGHSTFAHRGRSAAAALPAVLEALRGLDAARGARSRHPRIEAFVGRATNILVSAVTVGAPGLPNRMPVAGAVEGSVCFPPGEPIEDVMKELADAVAHAPLSADWPTALRPRAVFPSGVSGAEIAAEHPLFRIVDAAIEAETGRRAFVNPVHTASDIRVPILQHGVPTVGLGPLSGDLTQNGRTEEWVDAADHLRCAAVVARLLRNWSG